MGECGNQQLIVRFISVLGGIFLSALVHAQILFPELDGVALQEALRTAYTPASKLDLSQAKDTLYLLVERQQDSVRGIYSGYAVFLPDDVDPSQWVFMNGNGINLEHGYPQSKGADEGLPGHSDMHHLFPSRVAVNTARASHPFAEIPDNLTTTWYKRDMSMQSIPVNDIDGYSEYRNGAFEPRESVKGNIARAIFYFYTMYQEDADAADPDFFSDQREALCAWHLADPVDDTELQRSSAIATYQDGKENPFVLDCTAALRAWCPEFNGCTTAYLTPSTNTFLLIHAYYTDALRVSISSEYAMAVTLSVIDGAGRMVFVDDLELFSGKSEYELNKRFIPGIYTICATTDSGQRYATRCVVPR